VRGVNRRDPDQNEADRGAPASGEPVGAELERSRAELPAAGESASAGLAPDAESVRAARSLGGELRLQAGLAAPLVLASLGTMAMGTVDTLMVGRLPGEREAEIGLAAVTSGNVVFMAAAMFATGTLTAIDGLLSQAIGASDGRGAAQAFQRGLVLSVAFAVLLLPPLGFVAPILRALDQPTETIEPATRYVFALLAGLPAFLVFVVLRQSLQALQRPRAILAVVLAANLLNLGLDYVLIFGKAGLPAMGIVGSGWASSACRWAMTLGLLWLGRDALRPLWETRVPGLLRLRAYFGMLRVGAPVGVQNVLEFMAFGGVSMLMGWISPRAQAGHAVAINLAALSFMVPLGVSSVAAVRVGRAVGRDDGPGARRAALASIGLGAGFMGASGALFIALPAVLAGLYTDDPELIAAAAVLLPVAGAFQIFDGLQVVCLGLLRGAGDTVVPMGISLVGYWVLGFPAGYLLAFELGVGPAGLWWGLVVGLASVGVVLAARTRQRLGSHVARVDLGFDPD
jgi:MATE family multidrug resistance protein